MSNFRAEYFRFESRVLEESALKEAQKEILETEESSATCLKSLKRKLTELKDLEPCMEDEFLLKFLRVSKFDTSKAFHRILKFYNQQDKLLVSVFQKCLLSIPKVLSVGHLWASPYRLKNNSDLIIIYGAHDHTKISIEERIYLDILVFNNLLTNPVTQMCGATFINDYSGSQFSSLFAYTPKLLHLFIETVQNCLPLRIKDCHFVNMPPFLSVVFNLARSLVSEKLRSRVFVHSSKDNWKSLRSCIPEELLPEVYGGHLKQSQMINLLEDVGSIQKNFCEQLKFGYLNTKHLREAMCSNPPINDQLVD